MTLLTPADLERRVLEPLDSPKRRAIYREHFAEGPPADLVELFARLDLKRARVLDVGCGYGSYLVHFARGSLGLDRDPERVSFVRSLGLTVEERDVERPAWTEDLGPFDVVWMRHVLPLVEDPATLLATAHDLLAPDGRLVISDWLWPNRWIPRRIARWLRGSQAVWTHPDRRHRLRVAELVELLERAGYELADSWLRTPPRGLLRRLGRRFAPPRVVVARLAPPRAPGT